MAEQEAFTWFDEPRIDELFSRYTKDPDIVIRPFREEMEGGDSVLSGLLRKLEGSSHFVYDVDTINATLRLHMERNGITQVSDDGSEIDQCIRMLKSMAAYKLHALIEELGEHADEPEVRFMPLYLKQVYKFMSTDIVPRGRHVLAGTIQEYTPEIPDFGSKISEWVSLTTERCIVVWKQRKDELPYRVVWLNEIKACPREAPLRSSNLLTFLRKHFTKARDPNLNPPRPETAARRRLMQLRVIRPFFMKCMRLQENEPRPCKLGELPGEVMMMILAFLAESERGPPSLCEAA